MLLRRPTLAAFKHVYTFSQRYQNEPHVLWPSVRRELLVVMALAPILRCNLRRESWSKLVATDASMTGCGVVSTVLHDTMEASLWPVMTQSECSLLLLGQHLDSTTQSESLSGWAVLQCQQPVDVFRTAALDAQSRRLAVVNLLQSSSSHWSTVISSQWRRTQHINELELVSLLLSLRWTLSHPDCIGRQLHVLVDSTSVYYGVNKGRSSSPRMLALPPAIRRSNPRQ